MRLRATFVVLLVTALAVLGAAPSTAAPESSPRTIRVTHGQAGPTATVGTGLGAVRTFFVPFAVNGKAADDQYLTGTLTTVVVGLPDAQEIRQTNFVFVLGSQADQLVVGGVSRYATTSGTLDPGTRIVRPVLGGSGAYAGARGQVVSTNLGPSGWAHVFRLTR